MKVKDPDTGRDIDSSELCPLVFKSRQCGYRGHLPTCNKTFRTCQKLGNEEHFAGHPNTEVNL